MMRKANSIESKKPATKGDIWKLEDDIKRLEKTTKMDMESFQQKTKTEFDGFRKEFDDFQQGIRTEFDGFRQEMDTKIDTLVTKNSFNQLVSVVLQNTEDIKEIKRTMASKDDIQRVLDHIDHLSKQYVHFDRKVLIHGHLLEDLEPTVLDHEKRLVVLEKRVTEKNI